MKEICHLPQNGTRQSLDRSYCHLATPVVVTTVVRRKKGEASASLFLGNLLWKMCSCKFFLCLFEMYANISSNLLFIFPPLFN